MYIHYYKLSKNSHITMLYSTSLCTPLYCKKSQATMHLDKRIVSIIINKPLSNNTTICYDTLRDTHQPILEQFSLIMILTARRLMRLSTWNSNNFPSRFSHTQTTQTAIRTGNLGSYSVLLMFWVLLSAPNSYTYM